MKPAPAVMLESNHHHKRQSREEETNGKCAGVRTLREEDQVQGVQVDFATIASNNVMSNAHKTINPRSFDDLLAVVASIKSQVGNKAQVDIGIICGSGLGPIADQVEEPTVLPYEKIPGFPSVSVAGHKGNLLFGKISGKSVVCMQGRFHPYEHNMDLALCSLPIRVMHQLGVKILIVSNAAGGVNPKFTYGDLMLIKDHIFMPALAGLSPLVGLDSRFGERFVSVHDAYDKSLRDLAKDVAKKKNMRLFEGVYVMSGGPQYETPAEVFMYKTLGGDALGMSTCHEVTVARQCGIKVLGFSLITNIANLDADSSKQVSHEEVLTTAKNAGLRASQFVKDIISQLP
ncbi:hypothetical protein KIN20_000889 [Parelaphostrongylus tenuis]|uniref:Purine nucleoside phosphorylase n=1 Tax=Parelaphostrongylus tenuis TaxID=148309 RepID=A0AAD5MLB4_PARTN|nr:hypothetical protein KIN20_000889 [Parelaphostrongylus tenuis]